MKSKPVSQATIERRAEEIKAVRDEYLRLKDHTEERMAIWAERKAKEKANFNPCML